MLLMFAASLASSAGVEQLVYRCKGATSDFSFVYDRHGSKIDAVKIVDSDTPRLPPDQVTHWRGEVESGGAAFSFSVKHRDGGWTTGTMTLRPNSDQAGRFRLTWHGTMGGKGSDLVFENAEQSADCILRNKDRRTEGASAFHPLQTLALRI